MQRYTVSYTKVFAPDSLLAGLQYPTTETGLTLTQATEVQAWAAEHATTPVRALAGSNYTVADCRITED